MNVVPFAAGQLGEAAELELLLLAAGLVVVLTEVDVVLDLLVVADAEELPEILVMGVVASVQVLKKSMMSGVALK